MVFSTPRNRTSVGLGSVACALVALLPGCYSGWTTNPEFQAMRSASFEFATEVHVDATTTNGTIVVSQDPGVERTTVTADAWLRTQTRADGFELGADVLDGDRLVVWPRWPGGSKLDNETCGLRVIAPRLGRVTIESDNGGIDVTGGTGSTIIETGTGSIDITDRQGNVIARSENGRIYATRVVGGMELHTANGSIRVVESHPNLASQDGNDGSKWTIETANGGISTELGEDVGAQLFASTGNGTVSARLPSGANHPTTTLGQRVSLGLGDGPGEILLRTGNGSITIIVIE